MHSGLIVTIEKHQVSSPQPCAPTHSVHHTHTTRHDIQHHAIHAPKPDIQHIHLHLVYNATKYICLHLMYTSTQYIHLHPMYNTIHTSIPNVQCHTIHVPTSGIQHNTIHVLHRVQHNKYTCHDTPTTQCTYIVPHVHNTPFMTCT